MILARCRPHPLYNRMGITRLSMRARDVSAILDRLQASDLHALTDISTPPTVLMQINVVAKAAP